jgi:hypothetical protein
MSNYFKHFRNYYVKQQQLNLYTLHDQPEAFTKLSNLSMSFYHTEYLLYMK